MLLMSILRENVVFDKSFCAQKSPSEWAGILLHKILAGGVAVVIVSVAAELITSAGIDADKFWVLTEIL